MLNLPTLRQDLKATATQNLGLALQRLERLLDKRVVAFHNEFLLVLGQFNQYDKASRTQPMPYDEQQRQHTRLLQAFLALVDELAAEYLSAESALADSNYHRIAVISRDEAASAFMQTFFSDRYFKNCRFFLSDRLDDLLAAPRDLVVFNNLDVDTRTPAPADRAHLQALDRLLGQTGDPIVYLGEFYPPLARHRLRVNAANSPVSLYARLREMIEFMGYYGG